MLSYSCVLWGILIGVPISKWLYLTIMCASLYRSLGKRRNKLKNKTASTRKVNKHYKVAFLSYNLYMCLTATIIFYSLWVINFSVFNSTFLNEKLLLLSIPLVLMMLMKYSLNIENESSDGDPSNVLLQDKSLVFLVVIYALLIIMSVSIPIVMPTFLYL